MPLKLTPESIERTNVEQVFGLTGGELNDKPLVADLALTSEGEESPYEKTWHYSYEGVPEWAFEDFDRDTRSSASGDFFTICDIGVEYGSHAHEITVFGEQIYRRVQTYDHSGEAECPFQRYHPNDRELPSGQSVFRVDRHTAVLEEKHPAWIGGQRNRPKARHARCPYCEARVGEEHGYIYLGACAEHVYAFVGYVRGAHPEDGSCDCPEETLETESALKIKRLECGFLLDGEAP